MSKDDADDLAVIAAALRPGTIGRGRHSPLYCWLQQHADAFRQLLAEKRPSWGDVARLLAAQGLTNGNGGPLTQRRVQRTWYAVDKATRPQRQAPAQSPCPPPVNPSTQPPDATAAVFVPSEGRLRPRYEFKLARPRTSEK